MWQAEHVSLTFGGLPALKPFYPGTGLLTLEVQFKGHLPSQHAALLLFWAHSWQLCTFSCLLLWAPGGKACILHVSTLSLMTGQVPGGHTEAGHHYTSPLLQAHHAGSLSLECLPFKGFSELSPPPWSPVYSIIFLPTLVYFITISSQE